MEVERYPREWATAEVYVDDLRRASRRRAWAERSAADAAAAEPVGEYQVSQARVAAAVGARWAADPWHCWMTPERQRGQRLQSDRAVTSARQEPAVRWTESPA